MVETNVEYMVEEREALEGRMEGRWVCPCSLLSKDECSHCPNVCVTIYAATLSVSFGELRLK